MSDIYRVGSDFDPSGIIKGIDLAGASLDQFEKMVQQVSKSMPGLPLEAQFKIAAEGIKGATQQAKQYEAALKSLARAPAVPPFFGAGAGPNIIRDKVAELRLLSGQLQQSAAAANQFAAASGRMNMALLAGSSGRIGDNGASFQRGLANITAANAGVAKSFAHGTRSANMMRASLGTLAAQSVGTSTSIGRLAQSALFFAGGSGVVIAVAAAILAAAKAYEVLTSKAREAKKAHDDLVKSFQQRVEGETAALGGGASGRGAARFELQTLDIQERGLRIQKEIAKQQGDIVGYLLARHRLEKNIAEQKQITHQLTLDEARAERANMEARQAPGRELIGGLGTELATLKLGEEAVRRMTVANQAHTDSERAAALAILDQIFALERQKKAQEDATKAAEDAAKAQAELTARFNQFWDDIEARANLGSAAVAGAWKKLVADQKKSASDGLTAQIEAGFNRAADAAKRLKTPADEAAEEVERLAQAFVDIGTTAFGLADVGRSLGFIGEEAQRTLQSVGQLSDALAAVAANASFGNIVGAVVSFAGVINSLLGGGPSATDKLMAENNQRLLDLRISLDAQLDTAGVLASELAGVQGLMDVPLKQVGTRGDPRSGDLIPVFGPDVDEMRRRIEAAGFTVEEWGLRIERITGIDVLDEKGHLVAKTLGDAEEAFNLLIKEVTTFSNTLENITRQQDVEESLGLRPERSDLARNRDILLEGLDLGKKEEDRVRTLDLSTAEGQAAYKEFLKDIYKRAKEGLLTPAEIGKFKNVDDLLGPIGDGAEEVKRLGEEAKDAADAIAALTKQVLNAPHGINLEGYEFRAQAGGMRPRQVPFNPIPLRGTDGASLPVQTVDNRITGPVTVVVQGGRDSADEIAERVFRKLRDRQLATDGTPDYLRRRI